jgi:hypothetical protein
MKSFLNLLFRLVASIGLTCLVSSRLSAQQPQLLNVEGRIVNSAGAPLPGCAVYVASPFLKSAPVFSQADGSFTVATPLPSDDTSSAARSTPFLEIYWDQQLMFRLPLASLPIETAIPQNRSSSQSTSWSGLLHDGGTVVLKTIRLGT